MLMPMIWGRRDPADYAEQEIPMMAILKWRRNNVPFNERLQKTASEAREAAQQLPQGKERDALLRKASQAEVAAHLSEWLTSPGLQSPK
jgi:hypothetical protein